jgi:hypothetical protein
MSTRPSVSTSLSDPDHQIADKTDHLADLSGAGSIERYRAVTSARLRYQPRKTISGCWKQEKTSYVR